MAGKEAAMIELTHQQQQQAVDASPEPRLIDPRTQKVYVLIGAELYERVRSLLADDENLDMRQVATLVERAMREDDAGDPTLEFYQQKYGPTPLDESAESRIITFSPRRPGVGPTVNRTTEPRIEPWH
jgi:hypothetical protein